MKYFKTLQNLIDYVPNCLVCSKPLQLFIEGHWGDSIGKTQFRSVKTILKEELLYSKNKLYDFCIDPSDNEIFLGKPYFKVLSDRQTVIVYKKCRTCYCVLGCSLANKQYKNWDMFPDLVLDTEEIKYTMRNNKEISIYKNHQGMYYQFNPLIKESKISITINNKREYYPNEYIDFSKIKDLSSLNKKISTIMVFQ